MKNVSLLLAILIAAFGAGCTTKSGSDFPGKLTTANASTDDLFGNLLEEQMPRLLATNHVPGAVVSCIKDGDVAWTKAFGQANVRKRIPMQPDMVFNHGSDGKTMTAWGIMRLVEDGKLDLDAPANRYLKRWQIRSTQFDPNEVTIRRLLSHTAGLTVHGFSDYPKGTRLPSLIEVLEGKNQQDGPVFIKWKPGSTNVYSGGGYVILQMVIEDVTGQPFAEFIHQEVAEPLGIGNLAWVWTPQIENRAPVPYDYGQKKVGYRQLACQAVGSELCTVPDFARFLAATVPGPHGEPAGRGVLKPETIATMTERQPNTEPLHSGLGWGVNSLAGDKFLKHTGRNLGWTAEYVLAVNRREGFVIANNSFGGESLNEAVEALWLETILGKDSAGAHR